MKAFHSSQFGGAALEYILVSTFAAVMSISALGFVGKIVHTQLSTMGEKLGTDEEFEEFDPFSP